MLTAGLRRIARAIPPSARSRVHAIGDRLLQRFASVARAARPTDLVGLTFDDGPDPEVTPRLLDLFRERQVSASFFVLTDLAARHPELIRRMVLEGHEVALHSDRHDRLTKLKSGEVEQRIRAAHRLLESLTATPVTRFRPPYGAQGFPLISLANRMGLELVVWGPIAEDWLEQTAQQAADRLLNQAKGGDIALLHDGLDIAEGDPRPTFDRVEMVALILDGLAARNLRPTSVAKLIEAAGAYKSFWIRP